MSKKNLSLLIIFFFFLPLLFLGGYFLNQSSGLRKTVGTIFKDAPSLPSRTNFVDNIGIEDLVFDGRTFDNIAQKFGIWDKGIYRWHPDFIGQVTESPEKIEFILTNEEQKFFKAKSMLEPGGDLVTFYSLGTEYLPGERTLKIRLYLLDSLLDGEAAGREEVLDLINYQAAYALYKTSVSGGSKSYSADQLYEGRLEERALVEEVLEENGDIFYYSHRLFNYLNRLNPRLVKIALAQYCSGHIICGVETKILRCSSGGGCTIPNKECGIHGICEWTTTCDIGDDVNVYCPFRTSQSSCNSAGCGGGFDCSSGSCSWSSTPTPPPGGGNGGGGDPSCTVDVTPDTATIAQLSSLTFTASVSDIQNGTVESVDFSSSDENIVTVSPASDTTVVYETQATGQNLGSANVFAAVSMDGLYRCSDYSPVTVAFPAPWWQAIDADIVALGDITSTISGECTGACTPTLILDGAGGYPGIPIYSGALNVGAGNVSSTGWEANATYNDTTNYKYSYFDRKIPADAIINEIETPSITGSEIDTGGTEYDGYYWYHFDGDTYGDLTITSDVTIASDRKVILVVESADLYLQGNVTIQNDGQGFLLVIVGETDTGSKGNIFVDSGVSGSDDGIPEIEGLFMADNAFETGTAGADSDNQIHIRGSVAAYGGISLDRDLADDSQTPAEIFEYAPELMLLFPKSLALDRMRWEEVAP